MTTQPPDASSSGVEPLIEPPADPAADPMGDSDYRLAVVDLLGALAYGELTAFERLADDASFAPTIADKAALAAMAVAEYNHFSLLRTRLERAGHADPRRRWSRSCRRSRRSTSARRPATGWRAWSRRTSATASRPTSTARSRPTWTTRPATSCCEVLEDTGHSAFAVDRVRAAIEADPRLAGRLALWGRRLVGEALSQAQRVAAERDALAALLVGGVAHRGADLAEVGRMFARLTENHTRRMASLGLSA